MGWLVRVGIEEVGDELVVGCDLWTTRRVTHRVTVLCTQSIDCSILLQGSFVQSANLIGVNVGYLRSGYRGAWGDIMSGTTREFWRNDDH